jgi:hypothetical protein
MTIDDQHDVIDHVIGLADAAMVRMAALAPELDALTDQLQGLSESCGDEQLSDYLVQAALWAHQLSGTCTTGVAASLRGLKTDLVNANGDGAA